jgi:SAM-dependent methyltransferase
MKYAKDVVRSVVQYELHELGVKAYPEYELRPRYTMKRSSLSSHSQLLELVGPTPRAILDLGCGQGELGKRLQDMGHHVVGVDIEPPLFELDEFHQADIAGGIPLDESRKFDVILLADVLEHLAEPARLLEQAAARLAPSGRLLVSLPNAVHWSVRAQVARGSFEYANKGIMDRGHLRFFTKKTAERLFTDAGLRVLTHRTTPVPWENVIPPAVGNFVRDKVEKTDYFLGQLAPNAFAYQHVFELGLPLKQG